MANTVRMSTMLRTLVMIVLSLRAVTCSGPQAQHQQQTSTNTSTLQMLGQLSEKLFTKLNSHLMSPNRAKARGYDSWGYLDGYSHEVYGKSDYSWIIPLIIVIGFGTLLIPLMSTLMTTMMTQGTINLTAGRRRRRETSSQPTNSTTNWNNVLKSVEDALTKFGKHFKQW